MNSSSERAVDVPAKLSQRLDSCCWAVAGSRSQSWQNDAVFVASLDIPEPDTICVLIWVHYLDTDTTTDITNVPLRSVRVVSSGGFTNDDLARLLARVEQPHLSVSPVRLTINDYGVSLNGAIISHLCLRPRLEYSRPFDVITVSCCIPLEVIELFRNIV